MQQFVLPRRQRSGTQVHLLRQCLIDEVYDELVRQADVTRRVLRHAGRSISGTEAYDGWGVTQHIEKTEWGRIHVTFEINGGRQRNGARRDESGENHVSVFAQRASEVDFHRDQLRSARYALASKVTG
jgi:hypothetical protein